MYYSEHLLRKMDQAEAIRDHGRIIRPEQVFVFEESFGKAVFLKFEELGLDYASVIARVFGVVW